MASRKSFLSRPKSSYIFPASPAIGDDALVVSSDGALFEFDESELWNTASPASFPAPAMEMASFEAKKWIPTAARSKKKISSSVPVNVPDWSKILKDDFQAHCKIGDDLAGNGDSDGDDFDGDRIPPHEYLARTRGASLSVHEGVGRTLKGRDLRRVRNAIWKTVGFED